MLGEGAFGKVLQAAASDIVNSGETTTVAVKMLKEGHTDQVNSARHPRSENGSMMMLIAEM